MTTPPSLPAQGSTAWYSYAQWEDAKARNIIDVKADYGATGNGTTDDTAAINAAIAAAPTGGTVILPGGYTYLCSTPISVTKALTIVAHGATLAGSSGFTGTALLNVAPASFAQVNIFGLTATLPSANTNHVVRLANVQNGRIQGLTLSGGNRALFLDDGTNTSRFTDLRITAGTYGVYCKNDTSSAENYFSSVYITGPGGGNVTAGFAIVSTTTADIGGFYLDRVMIAGGGTYIDTGWLFDASGATGLNSSPVYMTECGADTVATPLWAKKWGNIFSHNSWFYCNSSGGRTITASTTASNTTITATAGTFTNADVGAWVGGGSIPGNATIASVTDATHAVLSAAPTTTATGVTVTITRADSIILNGCSDVQLIGNQIKGGNNGVAFRGASSGHVQTVRNRIPDAQIAYLIESASVAPTNFKPALDDMVGSITNDGTSLGTAIGATQLLLPAPRIRTSSSASGGALLIDNQSGDQRYIRMAGSSNIEILDNTYSTVLATFFNAGDFKVTGKVYAASLGVNNAAAATTPGSVVKKIQVFDYTGTSLGFIAVYSTIT